MKIAAAILAASTLVVASAAVADELEDLMKKNGCNACHAEDKKVIGPSYKDVAAKYKGDAGAVAKLAAKIKTGGKGTWGEIPMPPNNVTDDEAKKLAAWVLATK
jgi:cytochrome c